MERKIGEEEQELIDKERLAQLRQSYADYGDERSFQPGDGHFLLHLRDQQEKKAEAFKKLAAKANKYREALEEIAENRFSSHGRHQAIAKKALGK